MKNTIYDNTPVGRTLLDYGVRVTGVTNSRQIDSHNYTNYSMSFDSNCNYMYNERVVEMAQVEVPSEKLILMAEKLTEFDSLMQDPETARLVMEAKFIQRLKGRR